MRLHLPTLLRHALLACMACAAPAYADVYLAEGVNQNDLTASTRFYDGGKGRDWDVFERAAYTIYNNNGKDLSIFGDLASSITAPEYQSRLDCSALYNDSGHCWAYTSSNMLQYWQSYYGVFASKAGEENAKVPVHGLNYDAQHLVTLGGTQSLKLNKLFYDNFVGTVGGNTKKAFGWYLYGENEWGGQIVDDSAPGYFRQYFTGYDDTHTTVNALNINSLSGMSDSIKQAFGYTKQADGSWKQTVKGQIMHLELSKSGGSHAITCYGFETDASGNVSALYVVNSDDAKYELVKVYTKFVSEGEYTNYLELHYDEACSGLNSYNAWRVTGWSNLNTPEVLQTMLAEYSDTTKPLYWNGEKADWGTEQAADPNAIPSAQTGWVALVSTATDAKDAYASYYDASRPVIFGDSYQTGSNRSIALSASVSTPGMTVDCSASAYSFDGKGFTLTTGSLTKSGTAALSFTNITLAAVTTQVEGGSMELGSGAALSGTSLSVNSGSLSFTGGSATLTGALTLGANTTLQVEAGTSITASELTMGTGSTLVLALNGADAVTPALSLTGTLNLGTAGLQLDFGNTTLQGNATYVLATVTGELNYSSLANFSISGSGYDANNVTAELREGTDGKTLELALSSGAIEWSSPNGDLNNADGNGTLPGAGDTLALKGDGSASVTLPTSGAELNGLRVDSPSKDYELAGGELKVGLLDVRDGGLTVNNGLTTVSRTLSVAAGAGVDVAAGSQLDAAAVALAQNAAFRNEGTTHVAGALLASTATVENAGALTTGSGSQIAVLAGSGAFTAAGDTTIGKVEGTPSVVIEQGATLTVQEAVSLDNFSSTGSMHSTEATFTANVSQGGNVSADITRLNGGSYSFNALATRALTLQQQALATLADDRRALLEVDEISALGAAARARTLRALPGTISITLEGSGLEAGTYNLIHAENGLAAESFTLSQETLDSFRNERTEASLHTDGNTLFLTLAAINGGYFESKAQTANGRAAAAQLDALADAGAQAAHADLAELLDSLTDFRAAGDYGRMEEAAASAAGAAIPALGMAYAGDVSRQLRAIRNRMPSMGVDSRYEHPGMPYINAWINAEGGYHVLNGDATEAGFTLSQWGGTVGMDADVTEHLTVGLACSALYGDFKSDGVDGAEGDLDTWYASLFARVSSRNWVHSFVMTGGMADVNLDRTVRHGGGSYTTRGETEGSSFGLLYELAYTISAAEDESICWQPVANVSYVHTQIDAYTESGSGAALNVGEQSYDQVSFGAGIRMQAALSENLYERHSILELRALARADVGDREGKVTTSFTALPGAAASFRSQDYGAFGVELGAGLILPVSADSGELFMDVSADLRSGYSEVNGALGWRVHF